VGKSRATRTHGISPKLPAYPYICTGRLVLISTPYTTATRASSCGLPAAIHPLTGRVPGLQLPSHCSVRRSAPALWLLPPINGASPLPANHLSRRANHVRSGCVLPPVPAGWSRIALAAVAV